MIISSEQFNEAYSKLPYPIREFLASDDLGNITQQIGAAHQLHIDTIGALEREVSNMLLGLINPTQFVGELKSVGIPAESIGAIVEELNARVFIPLREKMKHPEAESASEDAGAEQDAESENDEEPAAPISYNPPPYVAPTPAPTVISAPVLEPVITTPPPVTAPPASVPPPIPTYVPPVRPSVSEFSAPFAGIPQIPEVAAPTQAPQPASAAPVVPATPTYTQPHESVGPIPTFMQNSQSSYAPSRPAAGLPPENLPTHARTMQEDMREAQAHPRSQTPQQPVRHSFQPTPTQFPAASVQTSAYVPPPAPTAPPAATQPTPTTTSRDALHSVLKEYGVDPYREPPE